MISRSADEVAKAIESNPLLKGSGIDLEKLHVMFLSDTPAATALKKLAGLTAAPDQSCCMNKEIYLYLPNGTAASSLMKSPLDRLLSVVTTTRNWKTVNALHQICQECSG